MAFPCWDEPVYKANFSITLEVDRKLTALSNMNQISSEELEGDMKLVKFATTPKMSTYLVAFAVGDFEFIEVTFYRFYKIGIYFCLVSSVLLIYI